MPSFVLNGPNIPESLLQAHEEGQVIFFCGAGISTCAELPLFRGLVDEIYAQLGYQKTQSEKSAYDKEQFDVTINLLEGRILMGRKKVRSTLHKILEPKLCRENALKTHRALLQLAMDRKGDTRIVTTNFDHLFKRVIAKEKLSVPGLAAPFLPVPKASRWNGLVYLHGLLPDKKDDRGMDRLVLSSGDFGLAYLTERWAARFVSELFRNFIVCFVGYGINDPVLRYMMDALAADKLLGEETRKSYAFAGYKNTDKDTTSAEWEAKGVCPLLYKISNNDHSMLRRTLEEWASTYRDDVDGKKMIIAQHASTVPVTPSRHDFIVGRVLWAMTDPSAAEYFASLNPPPPLEWLWPLFEKQFGHDDLPVFGIAADNATDENLKFSFLSHPTSDSISPFMRIADIGVYRGNWLTRWLTQHLNNPKLIFWISKNGGQLHERFIYPVEFSITNIEQLESQEKQSELDEIRLRSPQAIPSKPMRKLWKIVLSNRLKLNVDDHKFYLWKDKIKNAEITPALRMEIREILQPCVVFEKPFAWQDGSLKRSDNERIENLVHWNIVLASSFEPSAFKKLLTDSKWRNILPDLLQDFNILLSDALDLMSELGGADHEADWSFLNQPSISAHPQNRNFSDWKTPWTTLIELTRSVWLTVAETNPDQAQNVANSWLYKRYPLFKRMAFFAATHKNIIPQEKALDWLLSDQHKWLWSIHTRRETLRLIVDLSPRLNTAQMVRLESAILDGPPPAMRPETITRERRAKKKDRAIYLRLAKIETTKAVLGKKAKRRLNTLNKKYPKWTLAEDEQDEFSVWFESGPEDDRELLLSPKDYRELVEWLQKCTITRDYYLDKTDWPNRCRNDFDTAAQALKELSKKNIWPAYRWQEALQVWRDEKYTKKSWLQMASVLSNAPDKFIQSSEHEISAWMRDIAKIVEKQQESNFLSICKRIIDLAPDDDSKTGTDPLALALNHPVGRVTEALFYYWNKGSLKDGQGIPRALKIVFAKLLDKKITKLRHGRIFLFTRIVTLYRIDQAWTKKYLLGFLDWQKAPSEAKLAWIGFLRSPHLYKPLIIEIKRSLLETAKNYEGLGRAKEQYANSLTFISLTNLGDTFTEEELFAATATLPLAGLPIVARTLERMLVSAEGRRSEYWNNRVKPYLKGIWPQYKNRKTAEVSRGLARVCIATGNEFPDALNELGVWLMPETHPTHAIRNLRQENLCEKFPLDALKFLTKIIDSGSYFISQELKECLNDIKKAEPKLTRTDDFSSLENLCKSRGA